MSKPEKRLVEGLDNIARVLRLPRGIGHRRLKRWIRSGLPARRVCDGGPYLADPEELLLWWGKHGVQTSARNDPDQPDPAGSSR